jgi:hypothetical protein
VDLSELDLVYAVQLLVLQVEFAAVGELAAAVGELEMGLEKVSLPVSLVQVLAEAGNSLGGMHAAV